MKVSSGCLVRAGFPDGARYLLVHPSGNYNRKAPWSIPKGELSPGESAEGCALRETLEEAGVACKILRPLGEAVYRTRQKKILAFLAEPLEPQPAAVLKPASWEVDRVEFLTEADA